MFVFKCVYPRRLLHLIYVACLETLPRAAAFADDFNFLGVARPVITDELQAAFLGASRSAAIGTAVAAADGIPDGLGRSAPVFHVVITVLFLSACWRWWAIIHKCKHSTVLIKQSRWRERWLTGVAVFASPTRLAFATVILAIFLRDALTLATAVIFARVVWTQYWRLERVHLTKENWVTKDNEEIHWSCLT